MTLIEAAVWGLSGGMCVESLELYARIRRTPRWNWRQPIPQGMTAFVISVLIRIGVGAVLAAAGAGSGQVSSSLAAFGLGIGAPLVIEKLARAVPLTNAAVGPHASFMTADSASGADIESSAPADVESQEKGEAGNAR
jgi:hypothetical protein